MILQSISMKTTQNVQVMLTLGQTAIFLLCAKCACIFYCIPWVLLKMFFKEHSQDFQNVTGSKLSGLSLETLESVTH